MSSSARGMQMKCILNVVDDVGCPVPEKHDTLSAVFGGGETVICSDLLRRLISAALSARRGASQQGVAVSQLTRRRLTLFITCGTRQRPRSALKPLPEPERRVIEGVGVTGGAEESRKWCWCLQSLLYPLKTPQGWLPPFPHVWASKHRQKHNSPVTWDQHAPVQSGFVSSVLETYQNVQS